MWQKSHMELSQCSHLQSPHTHRQISYLQHQSSNTLPRANDTTWVICWDFFFPPGNVLQKQPGPFEIHAGFPSQKHSPPSGTPSLEAAKAPMQCIRHKKRSVSQLRRFLLIWWGLFVFAVFKITQHWNTPSLTRTALYCQSGYLDSCFLF